MSASQNKPEMWSIVLDQVRKQGFGVILLMAVTYHFQVQNDLLQQKVDTCNATVVQYYEAQLEYLQSVIQDNTRALDQNSQTLKMNQER